MPWVQTLDNPGLPPGRARPPRRRAQRAPDGSATCARRTAGARKVADASLGLELHRRTVASPYAAESSNHTIHIGGSVRRPIRGENRAARRSVSLCHRAGRCSYLCERPAFRRRSGAGRGRRHVAARGRAAAYTRDSGTWRVAIGCRVITEDTGGVGYRQEFRVAARRRSRRSHACQRPASNSLQLVEDYQLFGGFACASAAR